jgi:transposase-like protein
MNYSREERAKLLDDWRESGKSISAYVKEKGIVRWTFTKWLKAEREGKSGFVEVPTAVVKAIPQDAEILIEKGEIKIHIPLTIGGTELRTIIEVLAGAA